MSALIVSGVMLLIVGVIIAFMNSLLVLLRRTPTEEERMKYIGGNVAAALNVLCAIALFVLDMALKFGK